MQTGRSLAAVERLFSSADLTADVSTRSNHIELEPAEPTAAAPLGAAEKARKSARVGRTVGAVRRPIRVHLHSLQTDPLTMSGAHRRRGAHVTGSPERP